MIKVTQKKTGLVKTFKDDLLPAICVEVCGGGYSVRSVKDACILQDKVRDTGRGTFKGTTVEKVEA